MFISSLLHTVVMAIAYLYLENINRFLNSWAFTVRSISKLHVILRRTMLTEACLRTGLISCSSILCSIFHNRVVFLYLFELSPVSLVKYQETSDFNLYFNILAQPFLVQCKLFALFI